MRKPAILWPCALLMSTLLPAQNEKAVLARNGVGDRKVVLDVVVNDKSGQPVSGLQRSDFTVSDNREPQNISSFEAVHGVSGDGRSVEVVLVVDAVNVPFTRMGYERDQVRKILLQDAGRLSVPTSLVFFSDDGLKAVGTPSRDGKMLAGYLDQNQTGLRTLTRSQGYYGAVDRSQLSLRAIQQLANSEQSRPGRKLVIWVSPGWPLLSGPNVQLSTKDQEEIFQTIKASSGQLRQARMTVYAVDPLGTAGSGGFRAFYFKEFLKPVRQAKQAQLGNLALQVLAVHSGGRVLNSNNDVKGEIQQCIRDASSYYTLSFDSPQGEGKDDYHAIEVNVGQAGLKAQTLSGYYSASLPH